MYSIAILKLHPAAQFDAFKISAWPVTPGLFGVTNE